MPYPHENAARIKEPGDFQENTFRREHGGDWILPGIGMIKIPTTIDVINGQLKDDNNPDHRHVQALRFPTSSWGADEAKKWLKDHKIKYISFEPASQEKKTEIVTPFSTRAMFGASGLEIRKSPDGISSLVGHAVIWDELSLPILNSFRERVRKGACQKAIQENNIRMLWNHNSDFVLGSSKAQTLRVSEDAKGLYFECDLPDTSIGKDASVTISRGDVDSMSFGFNSRKQEWDETDPKNIVRTLIDIDLREISPTPFPAYPQTKVGTRSIEDDFNEFVEARKLQIRKEIDLNVNMMNIRKRKLIFTF